MTKKITTKLAQKITAISVEVGPAGDTADIEFPGATVSIENVDDFTTEITLTLTGPDFPFPDVGKICLNTGLCPVWLDPVEPGVWAGQTRATTGWQEMVMDYLDDATLPTMYV